MTTDEKKKNLQELLHRKKLTLLPSVEEVSERLTGEESLNFYLGIDPTGPDVHLGHVVQFQVLNDLIALGHHVTLLIGDFTARIGDPTGKGAARVALTDEQITTNMETYLEQAHTVLTKDSFQLEYNSRWLASLTMEQVLKLTNLVTVQQMIQRDMFQDRLKAEKPIYLNEFLYPLMQGYDSVALRTDGEIGGTDQTFNMLMGRTLEKELLGKDKIVIATPLLVDATTGKKMSKSEGTLIALKDSPQEIRRKVLDIGDSVVQTIFELCTRKDSTWIAEHAAGDARAFKEELAAELIRMFHGEAAVAQASEAESISATGPLDKVLKESGLAASMGEAKRLIDQKGVSVNGVTADRWDIEIKSGDDIQVGKGKKVKVAQ